MPNPNTTSQLIEEAPTPADAKLGPKSKGTELGQRARAVSCARSHGAGTAFPPSTPRQGSHGASPTQQQSQHSVWHSRMPTHSLESQRQLVTGTFPQTSGFCGNFWTCTHKQFLRPHHLHIAVASLTVLHLRKWSLFSTHTLYCST